MTHHQHQPQHGRGRRGEQYGREPEMHPQSAGMRSQGQRMDQPQGQRMDQPQGQRMPPHDQRMGGQQDERMGRQRGQQMGPGMGAQRSETGAAGGASAHSFDDHMTDELRIALEDFGELSHVGAWCAKECATGPAELGICARICQDIAEVAALNEMLIARDSMFGPEVADLFVRIADEGLIELQRFDNHPHVAETIATIERTTNSCESVLQQVRSGSQMGMQGGQRGMHEGGQHGMDTGRRQSTQGGRQGMQGSQQGTEMRGGQQGSGMGGQQGAGMGGQQSTRGGQQGMGASSGRTAGRRY